MIKKSEIISRTAAITLMFIGAHGLVQKDPVILTDKVSKPPIINTVEQESTEVQCTEESDIYNYDELLGAGAGRIFLP